MSAAPVDMAPLIWSEYYANTGATFNQHEFILKLLDFYSLHPELLSVLPTENNIREYIHKVSHDAKSFLAEELQSSCTISLTTDGI